MKNIYENIPIAEEKSSSYKTKEKNLSVSRNSKKGKREIKGYMKKEHYLKVPLQKAKI